MLLFPSPLLSITFFSIWRIPGYLRSLKLGAREQQKPEARTSCLKDGDTPGQSAVGRMRQSYPCHLPGAPTVSRLQMRSIRVYGSVCEVLLLSTQGYWELWVPRTAIRLFCVLRLAREGRAEAARRSNSSRLPARAVWSLLWLLSASSLSPLALCNPHYSSVIPF